MTIEWGLIYSLAGAAAAVGLGGIGSSIGLGIAGMASSGLLAEEPEKFGKALLLVALPSTQGIYGLIACFLILGKITDAVTVTKGLMLLASSLPVAVGGLFSGIYQGKVSASGINVVAKKPDDFMKSVIMSAMVETYAVFGLLATIIALTKVK